LICEVILDEIAKPAASSFAELILRPVEKDADGADVTELVTAAVVSNSGKTITLTITGSSDKISDVSLSRGTHAPVAATDITTSKFANTALGVLDTAIKNVNDTRATLGASMSRLEFASDNLQNVAQNTSAARSRVFDLSGTTLQFRLVV
jgi:flagellin